MNREESWILKEKYSGVESEAFHTDCVRLKAGEPLAYIIGSIPFLNTTIYLDSHPLIPRPETEFWVEKAIEHIKHEAKKTPQVLDLCAGSGAIGVAVAQAIEGAQVTFSEIDPSHLPTIKKNLSCNTIIYDSEKYTVTQSDLFKNIVGTFDFILSNPPYIDKDAGTAQRSVTDYEPHLALFGGQQGLAIITEIIARASAHLTKKGELWLEHEPSQVGAVKKIGQEHGFTVTVHNDQYSTPRYSTLTMAQ